MGIITKWLNKQLEQHKQDLYVDVNLTHDGQILKTLSIPYVPPVGSKIVLEESPYKYYQVTEIYLSEYGHVAHLHGKITNI